jgi:hypothetical protein
MIAAANRAIEVHNKAKKYGRSVRSIALIVASVSALFATEPPAGFLRKIAARETQNAVARDDYTYRQSVAVQEFNVQGQVTGEFSEVRDITYTESHGRTEQIVQPAKSTLTKIRLTREDFNDIRNVEPFLLTTAQVSLYEGRYQGEEMMDGTQCFVEQIRPKQILAGQRFFDGTIWVRETDLSVVRSEGQAVPQIETTKEQNLTPHFTTIRKEVDGKWMFPVETYADDTLYFRDWPQRIRTVIRYTNYKRFEANSTITFGDDPPPPPPPKK